MGEARTRKKLGLPPRGLKASSDPLPFSYAPVSPRLLPSPSLADSPRFEAFLWTWVHGVRLDRLSTGHCLSSTRIAAELLRGVGYTAEPERVWVQIHPPGAPHRTRGTTPSAVHQAPAGVFAGHVVLRVNDQVLLDVACQQYTDTPLPFVVFLAEPAPFWFQVITADGLEATYWTPTPEEIATETWDWRQAWETANLIEMGATPANLASLVQAVLYNERVVTRG